MSLTFEPALPSSVPPVLPPRAGAPEPLRVACLWVPDIGLAALLRAHPELRGEPVALVSSPATGRSSGRDASAQRAEGEGSDGSAGGGGTGRSPSCDPGLELAAGLGQLRVLARTAKAVDGGVRVGMTVAQARSACPGLLVRRRSLALERAAAAALRELARRHSPAVEEGDQGELYLDVRGLGRLFPSESALGLALCTQAARVGLPARVGVASSKGVARLASCTGQDLDIDGYDGLVVVPVGRERTLLGPLPVAALQPSRGLAETLARWGIRTAGELARLPLEGVTLRLGREGERLWLLARGEPSPGSGEAGGEGQVGGRLQAPLSPEPLPEVYEEGLDLEWACETLEPLAFLLRGIIGRLLDRLEGRGLACRSLDLRLGLERSRDPSGEAQGPAVLQRVVPLAIPTRDAETLLSHTRLCLGREPLPAAVVSLTVIVQVAPLGGEQLGLLGPATGGSLASADPEAVGRVVARLSVIAGEGQVGIPVAVDSHRPEAFALAPVTTGELEPEPADDEDDGGGGGSSGSAEPGGEVSALTLRYLRPPLELQVRARGSGAPLEVRAPPGLEELPASARIQQAAGPFRTGGEWWSSQPFGRDDWDVLLSTGQLLRIYRDHEDDRWYLAGLYD